MPLDPKERTKILQAKWKMSRAQREHEIKLALINAFAKDPDLKYYVGVAAGAGIAGVTAIFNSVINPPQPDTTGTSVTGEGLFAGWLLLGAGPLAAAVPGTPQAAAWEALKSQLDKMNPWGTHNNAPSLMGAVNSALGMSGLSFSGLCASVLILKAIFGEEGITKFLEQMGGALPALGAL